MTGATPGQGPPADAAAAGLGVATPPGSQPPRAPLDALTVARVRASWAFALRAPGDVGALFYGRLFTTHPHLRSLFARTDLAAQGEKLLQMVSVVLGALPDLEGLSPAIADLGRRHAGYGVSAGDYAAVGDALLWTLDALHGGALAPDVTAAWVTVYGALAARMVHGAPSPPAVSDA